MIRKITLTLALLIVSLSMYAQQPLIEKFPGKFSLGTRTTASLFNGDDGGTAGIGIGGQFRVQFSNRINSEWFADFITSSINNVATRDDYHIGWSLMYYPGTQINFTKVIQPYILAGHCFDYTRVMDDKNSSNFQERWSMAMQAGAGTHFNLTQRFDFSLSAQYMLHLGTKITASNSEGVTSFTKSKGAGIQDHILLQFL